MFGMASDHGELTARAMATLERVNLTARAATPAAVLSHGDQRKLEVGILLALEPDIFMFDEPTAGMSVAEVPVILDLIEEIRADRAKTILLVEHKMDVVRRLADRVIVLHQGALVADGEPAEMVASPSCRRRISGYGRTLPDLLRLEGVHTHIGRYHILHGVDLAVPEGELTMLLGRNGAGKTTTLRTVMGLWRASAGRISFAGADITRLPTPDIARLGIAYVPETMGIFSQLTVRENLLLATHAGRFDAARLDAIFALFPVLQLKLERCRRRTVGRAEADAGDQPRDRRATPHADRRRAHQGPGAGGDPAFDRRLPRVEGDPHDYPVGGAELPDGTRARR